MEQTREAREIRRGQLKKATGLPTAEARNEELTKVAWANLETDPKLAMEAFEQLTPGSEERNRLLEHLATKLAGENMDDALGWAATFGTPEERSLAYGSIAAVMSETDPEEAARLISEKAVSGRSAEVAVVKVVQRWAALSPESAADWVTKFNAGEMRSAGMKAITSSWMNANSEAAMSWISGMDEPLRKEANRAYAEAALEQPEPVRGSMVEKATPEMKADFDVLKAKEEEELRKAEEEEANQPQE